MMMAAGANHNVATARKRWLRLTIQGAIVVVVLVFGWRTVSGTLGELGQYQWQVQPAWLVVAGVLNLLGVLPSALFWHRLLRRMGQEPPLGESLRAYYVAQIGKYLPLKLVVVLIRIALIRSPRVRVPVATLAVVMESLTTMAVGGVIGSAGLIGFFPEQRGSISLGVLLVVLAALPISPPVLRRLARRMSAPQHDPEAAVKLGNIGFDMLLVSWLSIGAGWAVWGASLWAVLRSMAVPGVDLLGHLPYYTALLAFARVAGFFSGSPAGLGVADVALGGLLVHYARWAGLDAPEVAFAAVAPLALRVVSMLSEILSSTSLYLLGPRPAYTGN